MRMIFAAAAASVLASIALASANGEEQHPETTAQALQTATERAERPTTDHGRRVRLAFTAGAFDPAAAERAGLRPETAPPAPVTAAEAATPASVEAQRPVRTWFPADRSLQRGDIVVRDGDALVYEGVKNGKRHFRTVGLSRLVSNEERERILLSVRR